jgi:6-phosphogluconolactonase (cycloisomerase 2 family)
MLGGLGAEGPDIYQFLFDSVSGTVTELDGINTVKTTATTIGATLSQDDEYLVVSGTGVPELELFRLDTSVLNEPTYVPVTTHTHTESVYYPSMSADKELIAVSGDGNKLILFHLTNDVITKQSSVFDSTPGSNYRECKFSPSDDYLVVTNTNSFLAYERISNTDFNLNSSYLDVAPGAPAGSITAYVAAGGFNQSGTAFSSDGTYLAICGRNAGTTLELSIYQKNGSTYEKILGNIMASSGTNPSVIGSLKFTKDDRFLYFSSGSGSAPYRNQGWVVDVGNFTAISPLGVTAYSATPADFNSTMGVCMDIDPTNSYLVLGRGSNTGDGYHTYSINSSTGELTFEETLFPSASFPGRKLMFVNRPPNTIV